MRVGFKDTSRNWQGVEMAREKFGLMYSRNPTFHAKVVAWRRAAEPDCWEADCRFGSRSEPGGVPAADAPVAAEEMPLLTTMWYRLEAQAGSPEGQVIAEIDHR